MFEFKYTLSDEDYLEFNKFHLLNSPMGKKNLLITRLIVPIMLAIIMLPKALRSNNTTLFSSFSCYSSHYLFCGLFCGQAYKHVCYETSDKADEKRRGITI